MSRLYTSSNTIRMFANQFNNDFLTANVRGSCNYGDVRLVGRSKRVEWRCASMTSGGQCVMTYGTPLTPLWSASSWDMQPLEVSTSPVCDWHKLI